MVGKTEKRGFTLIEVVLVVTVIVLLAAFLIPTISKSVANANKTACLENSRTLGIALTSESALHRQEYATDIDMIKAVVAKQKRANQLDDTNVFEGMCPSGGKYSIVETQPERFAIVCSKHGDMDTLTIKYSELLAQSSALAAFEPNRLDSTAPDGAGRNYKISLENEMLTYYGIDLSKKTWCMIRTKSGGEDKAFSVYWSDDSMTKAKAGDKLDVVSYDIAEGEYSEGVMTVESYTDTENITYNRFKFGSFVQNP